MLVIQLQTVRNWNMAKMKPSSKLKCCCIPKLSYVTNARRHVGWYLLIFWTATTFNCPTIYQALEFCDSCYCCWVFQNFIWMSCSWRVMVEFVNLWEWSRCFVKIINDIVTIIFCQPPSQKASTRRCPFTSSLFSRYWKGSLESKFSLTSLSLYRQLNSDTEVTPPLYTSFWNH